MKLKPEETELEALYRANTNALCCYKLGITQRTLLAWIDGYGIKRKDSPGRGSNSSDKEIFSRLWLVTGAYYLPTGVNDQDQFYVGGLWIYKDDLVKLKSRRIG